MTTHDRQQIIASILDAAERPCPAIVPRCTFQDPATGRHDALGLPYGLDASQLSRRDFFCYQADNGTTYGKPFASEQEARDHWTAKQRHDRQQFAAALETYDDAKLASSAEFWEEQTARRVRLAGGAR